MCSLMRQAEVGLYFHVIVIFLMTFEMFVLDARKRVKKVTDDIQKTLPIMHMLSMFNHHVISCGYKARWN